MGARLLGQQLPGPPQGSYTPAYLFLIRSDRRSDGGFDDLGPVLQARESDGGVVITRIGDRHIRFGSEMRVIEIVRVLGFVTFYCNLAYCIFFLP
jgi:hypothetical protein